MELIEFKDVTVQYTKQKTVLDHVNLEINEGSITAFLGPNGSGKTTLLSTLNRLVEPSAGELFIAGQNIKAYGYKEIAAQIATVPQANTPNFSYSVYHMIMWGRSPYISYLPKKSDHEIVEETMERIGVAAIRNKPFNNLSGGEKQMVLIARALVQKAKIVLMDEPATYLDLKNQAKVLQLVKELNRTDGVTFVITLHEPNHALFLADDVVLFHRGKVRKGPTANLVNEENMRELYQVESNFIAIGDRNYMLVDYGK